MSEITGDTTERSDFVIVGLGGSAGSIPAFREFFRNVPADSDMAYVVVLHLSTDYDSDLAAVLQRSTTLPVTQVQEDVKVEPNRVYVIPPNKSLAMSDGTLVASDITGFEERRAPIDIFFRTLADTHESRAVCVVLSGSGSDGSMGLRRIKENNGLALVQDPDEAEFDDMPRSSIATGLVDFILPVTEMPQRMIAYRDQLQAALLIHADRAVADEQALIEVFTHMRVRTGHDFTNYKRTTVLRRIYRRLAVRGIDGLSAYAAFLRQHPGEVDALLRELLISVTNFFRDRPVWERVEEAIIPRLFEGKGPADHVRVWVAGCATGEEAYTVAMLLGEAAAELTAPPHIQVFSSDLDEQAIAKARKGFYTIAETADVSPERLRRHFVTDHDGFRVRRELREIVLFAHHNVLRDPPFSHLQFVTCRNLLIYLNRTAQERALQVLHFALDPGGYLLLGTADSIDRAAPLFATFDKQNHIYESRGGPRAITIPQRREVPAAEAAAEELETSQEELQSLNEELHTVNEELKVKIEELGHANNDLRNLMSSTEIGTIFVDRDFRVKLFTPRIRDVFNLITTDIGRSLLDITSKLRIDNLAADVELVRDRLQTVEREVQTRDGRWHLMRLLPYRTADDRIEGTVLTFIDVTDRKRADDIIRDTEERQRMLLALSDTLRTMSNPHEIIATAADRVAKQIHATVAYAVVDGDTVRVAGTYGDARIPGMVARDNLRLSELPPAWRALSAGEDIFAADIGDDPRWGDFGDVEEERRVRAVAAVPLLQAGRLVAYLIAADRKPREWTLTDRILFREVADRTWLALELEEALRHSEARLQAARDVLEQRVRERTQQLEDLSAQRQQLLEQLVTATEEERQRIGRELHDELGQHITALRVGLSSQPQGESLSRMQAIVQRLDETIDRLTLELRPSVLDHLGLHGAITSLADAYAAASGLRVAVHLPAVEGERFSPKIETTIYRVAQEALTNVWKHARASTVSVILEREGDSLRMIVEDDGQGFESDAALTGTSMRGRFGLLGMRERLALVDGSLAIESQPGSGTTIYVRVPLSGNGKPS